MERRYRNGWWLERKYWDEGLTQAEIADLRSVSPRTIRKYMDRYGIETRDMAGETHPLYGKERPPDVMGPSDVSKYTTSYPFDGFETRRPLRSARPTTC